MSEAVIDTRNTAECVKGIKINDEGQCSSGRDIVFTVFVINSPQDSGFVIIGCQEHRTERRSDLSHHCRCSLLGHPVRAWAGCPLPGPWSSSGRSRRGRPPPRTSAASGRPRTCYRVSVEKSVQSWIQELFVSPMAWNV